MPKDAPAFKSMLEFGVKTSESNELERLSFVINDMPFNINVNVRCIFNKTIGTLAKFLLAFIWLIQPTITWSIYRAADMVVCSILAYFGIVKPLSVIDNTIGSYRLSKFQSLILWGTTTNPSIFLQESGLVKNATGDRSRWRSFWSSAGRECWSTPADQFAVPRQWRQDGRHRHERQSNQGELGVTDRRRFASTQVADWKPTGLPTTARNQCGWYRVIQRRKNRPQPSVDDVIHRHQRRSVQFPPAAAQNRLRADRHATQNERRQLGRRWSLKIVPVKMAPKVIPVLFLI